MELDQSNGEKSNKVTWATSDDQDSGHVRSYRCSFCQRGFSNAQALGGHMNIHRKDRARLKEFSSDKSTLSLDIRKNQSPAPPPPQVEASSQLESSDERCCTPKRPCTSPIEIDSDTGEAKDDFGDKLQLSLSIETSSSSNEKDESSSRVGKKHVKRSMQLNHGVSQTTELDLELRLGPEPHDATTKG